MAGSIAFDILAKDHASKTFDKVGASADRSHSKFSKFGAGLKTAAKVGVLAIGAAAVGGGIALAKMAQQAAEDEVGAKRLAKALQNSAGATKGQVAATEDWISKQGVALGVTDDELRPALTKLVGATHDVGKAQKLASLAMDVSAGSGKSLDAVSTALTKAQNGQVSGLSRLGIKTKDAAGHTLSLKQVTKELSDQYGGQAATKANTFQGKMDRLKLVFDETKEAIGYRLIPILSALGTWFLNKGLPAIQRFGHFLGGVLGPVFKDIGNWIKGTIVPAFQGFGQSVSKSGGTMDKLKGALKSAKPFFDILWIVIKKLVEFQLKVYIPTMIKIANVVLPILGKAFGALGKIIIGLWNNFFRPVLKLILTGIGGLLTKWGGMLRALGKVPGFGWAKKAGDAMVRAGGNALEMAGKIKRIPNSHTTEIKTPGMAAAIAAAKLYGNIYDGIPRTVRTQIITTRVTKMERQMARASGGPVRAGVGYRINENGVESFVPAVNGRMLSASETQKMTSRSGTQKMVAPEIHLEAHIHLEGETIVKSIRTRNRNRGVASAGI